MCGESIHPLPLYLCVSLCLCVCEKAQRFDYAEKQSDDKSPIAKFYSYFPVHEGVLWRKCDLY